MTALDLLREIEAHLNPNAVPSLTSGSDACDLFEAYVLCILLEAARIEGATIRYEDVTGGFSGTYTFRTSPGNIHSTAHPYTHAIIEFPNRPALEAHIGIMIEGKSGVAHESDVAVLFASEAETCRRNQAIPRCNQVILSIECKYYSTRIPLYLARGFMGLVRDIQKSARFFVVNTSSDSVERLLTEHNEAWEHQVSPRSTLHRERLRNSFQTQFKLFKARK